ncbi:beta 1,3 glucan synthase [Phycomyces blakesleeanus NRRL 1555(-)]|uniref:1,3-beta-glucan synthase n=1 Tax=Phycomyces blakesleeanus (strain ATCC 8743b / DSM 1359 / FGSC 10004 / NBRC 33097 / NRRL 1555) TaxID=763407 RepID=A0A162UV58_PHYB8|nr:beta 1,3 glucan synthase [Phycomyces blakesleeanus NRRL 1555(-)]OAD78252.1 beta 1,3 glucan synthase [Phycomyces blakesleeanus NRRL 1555(-)]|eukprot:XP_018296292.1 beta 1,3 glucan synthase [Phycomyces blakesleeanus NRRL 1555(-)]
MYDHLMTMLDSRASRMSPKLALLTIHAEYIGGPDANYRKWYFAAQLDLNDVTDEKNVATDTVETSKDSKSNISQAHRLKETKEAWRIKMERMKDEERIQQLALWLLLWAEASVIRFCPEVLCFIFKLAEDHWENRTDKGVPAGTYLDTVITPLYNFIRDQSYRPMEDGRYTERERDHACVIGYDDVNQQFWYPEKIALLRLNDKRKLVDLHPSERYQALGDMDWNHSFQKTFKEKRSWMHMAVNFTRIWIIHIVTFWYYISANAGDLYLSTDKDEAKTETPVKLSVVALGGAIATLLVMLGSLVEYMYVPMSWYGARILSRRFAMLFGILVLNTGPSFYCVFFDRTSRISLAVSAAQLFISVITSLYFSIMPQSQLFVRHKKDSRRMLASQTFTANFPPLKRMDRLISVGLWSCVFICKLLESYFFLALSFKDPLRIMSSMQIQDCRDPIIGTELCVLMPSFTLGLMLLMALVLFFLDTYLWYVVWNTVFSVARSFYLGISIWTPWRNIFSRLPKRIYAKILAGSEIGAHYKPKFLYSQVWNAFVISMYREHLLSPDHITKLLYQRVPNAENGKFTLKSPTFFETQEDIAFKTEYYPQESEAERRMQFFAQSMTTPMPDPLPVQKMPTFTVMTPHYGEKIIFSLREIIREEDKNTRITLLEYLKKLHPFEWDNFVKDTKVLVDETSLSNSGGEEDTAMAEDISIDDLPFYCVGFKSSAPEYTLRTRIWASLRSQTLYRTITGFMNYQSALKLLYRVENPELVTDSINFEKLESDLEQMANRKFRFLIAMQRYASFDKEELENVDYVLKAYPNLQIAYLEEEKSQDEDGKKKNTFYSVLIDGHSTVGSDGKRTPKYRVRLPGNPILGDGKSDNQNTALIYYRGEYLQLVDANQDNYLEECLKIRNVLSEFENLSVSNESPYADVGFSTGPVAIVGAREYIFSENIGVLGDVAAGKEQTFGTLTQRIMATIGGKLHYGHPDFLNAIFMTTRGGVSKAQKGLHLNEDIYAGMNAFERGGRIKHIEYYQCGKGRDLGFGSILNFVTKIGTGMGEQMLSREYYYIGTQLPLDRFLTFYYAHPGFHINNIFIMLSVHMFMIVLLFLASMSVPLLVCEFDKDAPPEAPRTPDGCYDLVPIYNWLKRVVISIFAVFFISFLPLFLQELTERGFMRATSRLCKHIISLSPFFEIFVTQTYASAILNNLTFGGARYIGTGRGFATTRLPFSLLYSRFADSSIYVGARSTLILLFGSLIIWAPHYIYFWITVIALMMSPFLFNPHQFSMGDFIIDYRELLRWLSRGNGKTHASSWIGYCRFSRMRTTGVKIRQLGDAPKAWNKQHQSRARFGVIFFSEIAVPFFLAVGCVVAYLFTRSFDMSEGHNAGQEAPSGLIRIAAIAVLPLILNAGVLVALFCVSLLGGILASLCCSVKFGATVAGAAHAWAVINFIGFFELFYFLEKWNLSRTILGMIAVSSVQRFIFKLITVCLLTREFQQDGSNQGWWTGRWYGRGLGWYVITQPLREFVCKVVEMSLFAADFVLTHFIMIFLFLICFVPGINKWHSLMLFWLKPSMQIREPIYSTAQRQKRRRICILYGFLLTCFALLFFGLLIAPSIIGSRLEFKLDLPI